jgi:hypothetical protein
MPYVTKIEVDSNCALLFAADDQLPMRLAWTDYPEAFVKFLGNISDKKVQVDKLQVVKHANS